MKLRQIALALLSGLSMCLCACSSSPANQADIFQEPITMSEEGLRDVYQAYVANGGTLTYEEWLETIRGEKGDPGRDGSDGQDGQDGNTLLTGLGKPSSSLGNVGDSYIDLTTWDYYVKSSSGWEYVGNMQGSQEVTRCTATFYVDGAFYVSQTVDKGEKIARPDDPYKAGYRFVGWADEYGDFWVFGGFSLTQDISLYAVFAYAGTSSSSEATSEWTSQEHLDSNVITEPTTITIATSMSTSYIDRLNEFASSFKDIEPNVTVEITRMGVSYEDCYKSVLNSVPTQTHPDIFINYPDYVAGLMDYGVVVDVEPYMEHPVYGWREEEEEDLVESLFEEGGEYALDGVYSLPFAPNTEALYYNKTVLLGLDLSDIDASINGGKAISEAYLNNLTWEELFNHLAPALLAYDDAMDEAHKILKNSDRYSKGILGYDSDSNLFMTLAEQYGYDYAELEDGKPSIQFVNDGMKGLMKTFKDAYDKGYFFTKGSSKGGIYTNYSLTAQSSLFCVGSTSGAKYVYSSDFDTGVAPLPHAEGQEKKAIIQGPAFAILDHHDEARALASWLFYKHVISTENNLTWANQTGYLPLRESVYAHEDFGFNDAGDGTLEALYARNASYFADIRDNLFPPVHFKEAGEVYTCVEKLLIACMHSSDLDSEIDTLFQNAYMSALTLIE